MCDAEIVDRVPRRSAAELLAIPGTLIIARIGRAVTAEVVAAVAVRSILQARVTEFSNHKYIKWLNL